MKMKAPALSTLLFVATACAQPIQWRVEDGGNGHFYQVVVTPLQTWLAAKTRAESMGGYLASITSSEENNFIWNSFNIGGTSAYWAGWYDGPVFGAYRASDTSPWTWLSGEQWNWSNFGWSSNSGECGAQFINRSSAWDDIDVRGGVAAGGNVSMVVEWNNIPSPMSLSILGLAKALTSRRRVAPQQAD